MASKVKTQEEVRTDNVVATVSSAEQFYNKYKKCIWGGIIAIIVIGLIVLGYSKFIYGPAAKEAQAAAFPAELSLQAGEFQLALEGDGNVLGFAYICDQYGAKAGKSVYLSAAVCAAQLGRYEEALSYAKKYNGKEEILAARALALQGDCYVALDNLEKGVEFYEKAAAKADNIFAAGYLVKAGEVYIELGQKEKALKCFETVKDKYQFSIEAYDIDKWISKVSE